jgi:hypothetical protein
MRWNPHASAALFMGLMLAGCSGDKTPERDEDRSEKPIQAKSDSAKVVLKVPEMT